MRPRVAAAVLAPIVALTVLVPAPARADTVVEDTVIGPIEAPGGYHLSILVTERQRGPVRMRFEFERLLEDAPRPRPVQRHVWSFTTSRDTFWMNDSMSRARIDTGRQLGRYGRIDMRWEPGNGSGVGDGICLNSDIVTGDWKGILEFHSKTRTLGTVVRHSAFANLRSHHYRGGDDCPPPPPECVDVIRLRARDVDHRQWLVAEMPQDGARPHLVFTWMPSGTAPARVLHQMEVAGTRGSFAVGDRARWAEIRLRGDQEFLSGRAAYGAPRHTERRSEECVERRSAGTFRGDLTAHFDVGGDRTIREAPAAANRSRKTA